MGRTNETSGVVTTLSADDFVAAIPQLKDIATLRTHSPINIPSAQLTFEDIFTVAAEIKKLASDGSAGIVITQGTDTIEETAYALDLLLDLDIPVVVTGAIRNPTRPGAGETLTCTYGFEGSEIDLLSKGLIPSGQLNGCRAGVLLTILFYCGVTDKETLQAEFLDHGTR